MIHPADVPRQLAAAELAWRPLRRVARYASADAWTLAVCAVLSVPCLIGGVSGILLAVVLGGVAFVEFRAVRQLRHLDPSALRRLALNQLVLAGAGVLYALWNLYLTMTDRGLLAYIQSQQGQLGLDRETLSQVIDTLRLGLYCLYGILAVLSAVIPPITAWVYASKRPRLQAYLDETPALGRADAAGPRFVVIKSQTHIGRSQVIPVLTRFLTTTAIRCSRR